jgi:hypothetical protein
MDIPKPRPNAIHPKPVIPNFRKVRQDGTIDPSYMEKQIAYEKAVKRGFLPPNGDLAVEKDHFQMVTPSHGL